MFGLGTTELVIVMVIILVLFGGAKLPKLARSLGQAQNEYKKGISESTPPEAGEGADAAPESAKKNR